jgi:RNA polymerase sigma-70 factor (ECF subfamily)
MTTESQLAKTFREEHGRVLAALISQFEDFDLAEDALQDALVNALEHWKVDGIPRNPGAWLTTVAKRRAIDRLRRSRFEEYPAQIPTALAQEEPEMDDSLPDDRLKAVCPRSMIPPCSSPGQPWCSGLGRHRAMQRPSDRRSGAALNKKEHC